MLLHINYNSGEPISRQIVDQIKWMIVSGKLKASDKLPSIRTLARDLKINPTTVTRIYSELASEGIIALRQGQGAFVMQKTTLHSAEHIQQIVAEKAKKMLVEGLRLGLTKQEIEKIVNIEFKKIRTAKHG